LKVLPHFDLNSMALLSAALTLIATPQFLGGAGVECQYRPRRPQDWFISTLPELCGVQTCRTKVGG